MGDFIARIFKYPIVLFNKIFLYFYYEFSRKGYYYKDDVFKNKGRRVLFIAPCISDETIGAGATLIKHGLNEDEITCLYMTNGLKSGQEPSEDLIQERKEEALRIKEAIGISEMVFMDVADNDLRVSRLNVEKMINLLEVLDPYMIYTPFLIDSDMDNINSTRILIEALREWNPKFKQIYMYEANTKIRPQKINNIVLMSKSDFQEKKSLYDNYKTDRSLDFEVFNMIDRSKRYITDEGYAIESFTRMDFEGLDDYNSYLLDTRFDPNDFKEVSNMYNLFLGYMKNRDLKNEYIKSCKPLL